MKSVAAANASKTEQKKKDTWIVRELKKFKRNSFLFFLLIPGLIYYIIFHYVPIYGLLISFKNYRPGTGAGRGILGSPWADNFGFEHFIKFFNTPDAIDYIWNTIALSALHILWLFPFAILLALFINELKSVKFKKLVQTVSYLPHFVSITAIASMLTLFLSSQGTVAGAGSYANEGILNQLLLKLGVITEGIPFLERAQYFRTIYIASDVWQGIGWSAIVYIAALSGVDQELYEAATIDGASRLQKMWYISVQLIRPTIVILLIMQVGKIMSLGSDKALLLQRPSTYEKSQILSTYIYNQGIASSEPKLDYSTAVGLFNSLINLLLVCGANVVSRKLTDSGLW